MENLSEKDTVEITVVERDDHMGWVGGGSLNKNPPYMHWGEKCGNSHGKVAPRRWRQEDEYAASLDYKGAYH